MRPMKSAAWIALLCAVFLSAPPLYAAGAYSENFNDGLAQGWTSPTTWSASANYYRNTDEGIAVIATYTGDTWSTNYIFNAQLLSEFGSSAGATGNKVGLVFNYVDTGNYYRLLVNTKGEVELKQLVDNSEIPIGLANLLNAAAVNADTPYNVQVALAGNKVTVRVAGETVFSNVTLTGLTASRIGVISRFNHGQFDNISITPTANLIFKTGFDGASIGAPERCSGVSCFQPISGTDPVTGFSWPVNVWNLRGEFQTIAANPVTPATLSNYILNEIRTMAGPQGNQTKVLYQGILQPRQAGSTLFPQDPHYIYQNTPPTTQGDLYIRYWVKLNSDTGAPGLGSWRNLIQWKTGGDFRLNINTGTFGYTQDCASDGTTFWRLHADNDANSTDPNFEKEDYWEKCNKNVAVPVAQWFKLEFFWHRGTPGGTDGRAWVAVNGQQLFNETGKQMWGVGPNPKPINRIMAPQLYTGTSAVPPNDPIEQFVDDYEIWDGFPADASPH